MSTRCTISVQMRGHIRSIYCHSDGSPLSVGDTLSRFYGCQARAEELVSLGDLSILGPSTWCPPDHSFDHPHPECCVYYTRDRGDPPRTPSPGEWVDLDDMRQWDAQEEYNYLFTEGRWFFTKGRSPELEDLGLYLFGTRKQAEQWGKL